MLTLYTFQTQPRYKNLIRHYFSSFWIVSVRQNEKRTVKWWKKQKTKRKCFEERPFSTWGLLANSNVWLKLIEIFHTLLSALTLCAVQKNLMRAILIDWVRQVIQVVVHLTSFFHQADKVSCDDGNFRVKYLYLYLSMLYRKREIFGNIFSYFAILLWCVTVATG